MEDISFDYTYFQIQKKSILLLQTKY